MPVTGRHTNPTRHGAALLDEGCVRTVVKGAVGAVRCEALAVRTAVVCNVRVARLRVVAVGGTVDAIVPNAVVEGRGGAEHAKAVAHLARQHSVTAASTRDRLNRTWAVVVRHGLEADRRPVAGASVAQRRRWWRQRGRRWWWGRWRRWRAGDTFSELGAVCGSIRLIHSQCHLRRAGTRSV